MSASHPPSGGDAARPQTDRAGIVVAAILALAAGVIVWDALRLQSNNVYGLGPEAMAIVVAIGLALLAVGNLIIALKGDIAVRESMDFPPVLLVLCGLAAMIACVGVGGGFILAESALFVATSAAFGRRGRAVLIDIVIALVMSTLIYLAFDRLLTLTLPAGPIERLL